MQLQMIRGDSKTFAFMLTDADGDPIDLTIASVTMTAKSVYTDADGAAVFQKTVGDGVTVIDDTGGTITVDVEPEDTSDLSGVKHRLYFDVQVQTGTTVRTPVRGRLLVEPDVTVTVEEAS
jgi:hypothetical protein